MSNEVARSLEALRAKRDAARDLADAAPELLRALIDAEELIALLHNNSWDRVDITHDPRPLAIRAAIAKATGSAS